MRWVLLATIGAATLVCLARLMLQRGNRRSGQNAGADVPVMLIQILMGAGMTAMLVAVHGTVLAPWWEALFLAGAAWMCVLACRALRKAKTPGTDSGTRITGYVHHAVSSLAMFYMFAAAPTHPVTTSRPAPRGLPPGPGHAHGVPVPDLPAVGGYGPAGLALPLVAWVLITYFVLSTAYSATDLINSHRPHAIAPDEERKPADRLGSRGPGLRHAVSLVMELGMAYMLLAML